MGTGEVRQRICFELCGKGKIRVICHRVQDPIGGRLDILLMVLLRVDNGSVALDLNTDFVKFRKAVRNLIGILDRP